VGGEAGRPVFVVFRVPVCVCWVRQR
jgi:hypothetical protein